MVYQKDEAASAKLVAEEMFNADDIKGAMKFAVTAQNLDPTLEGITEMVTTLGVYTSAEKNLDGVATLYDVLGMDPSADEDTMLRQYTKLSEALNPEINKSIGVDGANEIISDAWSVLSDKAKRAAYDKKIKAIAVAQAINVVQEKAFGRGKRKREESRAQGSNKVRKQLFAENEEIVPGAEREKGMQQDTGSQGELQMEEAVEEITKKLFDVLTTDDAGEKAVEEKVNEKVKEAHSEIHIKMTLSGK